MFNFGKALASVGMKESIAKGQATRLAKKAGVIREDGMITVEDFMLATAEFTDAKNTSKYKEGILTLRANIETAKIPAEWLVANEPKATPTSPFVYKKVVDALVEENPSLGVKVDELIAKLTAPKE